jgi:hypothetical protein
MKDGVILRDTLPTTNTILIEKGAYLYELLEYSNCLYQGLMWDRTTAKLVHETKIFISLFEVTQAFHIHFKIIRT